MPFEEQFEDDSDEKALLDVERLGNLAPGLALEWARSKPFRHLIIDDFLAPFAVRRMQERFPPPEHPVWLDWRKRSPNQYGKQGAGDDTRFDTLDPVFRDGLEQFNDQPFLNFLQSVTGIPALLPDAHFTGGGMHQILAGGILDIHTDFNFYDRLKLYRRLNVLLYLTSEWQPAYGGSLELWTDAPSRGGHCFQDIPPESRVGLSRFTIIPLNLRRVRTTTI
ncbi:2OG-Fe(II) oxygenase [Sphingomonas sp. 28-62-11]|uniref:2OG-Fe(II) oxygenase n=1 Tax=Sphingomonas sp. 28-62-11 TaxID=1970432 RepID=UPI000BDC8447|nr:MAG: hypothetical protein B7Y49_00815 [Sphingomonas sp. 28-62-11]